MSETKPKMSAAERAAKRRERLMKKEDDRLKTILGDRLAPGDDMPTSSAKKEEIQQEKLAKQASNNASASNTDDLAATIEGMKNGNMPDLANLAGLLSGGANPQSTAAAPPAPNSILKNGLNIFIAFMLVLLNNKILTLPECCDSYNKFLNLDSFSNLFTTILFFQITNYLLLTKNGFKSSKIFSTCEMALNMVMSPSTVKMLLVCLYILIDTGKNLALFVVMNVIIGNVYTNFLKGDENLEAEEEPVIDLD